MSDPTSNQSVDQLNCYKCRKEYTYEGNRRNQKIIKMHGKEDEQPMINVMVYRET